MNTFTISTAPSGPARTTRNRRKRQRRRARRQQQVTTASTSATTITVQPPANQARRPRRRRGGGRGIASVSGLSPVSRFYLSSLTDPCGPPGAKVPDVTCLRTGTARLVYRKTIAVPDLGFAVMATPLVRNGIAIFNPNEAAKTQQFSFTGDTGFLAAYSRFRPVSMCLDMEFTGSTNGDAGLYFGNRVPPGWAPSSQTTGGFADAIDSVLVPIRNGGGIRVVWAPEDNSDYEFVASDFGSDAVERYHADGSPLFQAYPLVWHDNSGGASHLDQIGSERFAKFGTHAYPSIYAGITGPTSGATCVIQITLNVEAIANEGVNNFISTSPSPADPVGLAKVSSVIENLPSVSAAVTAIGSVGAAGAAYYNWQNQMVTGGRRNQRDLMMGSYSAGTLV